MIFLLSCMKSIKPKSEKTRTVNTRNNDLNDLRDAVRNLDADRFESTLKKITGLNDLVNDENRALRRAIRYKNEDGNNLLHILATTNTNRTRHFMRIFRILDRFGRYNQKNSQGRMPIVPYDRADALIIGLFAGKTNLRRRFLAIHWLFDQHSFTKRTPYLHIANLRIRHNLFMLTAYAFRDGRKNAGRRRLRALFRGRVSSDDSYKYSAIDVLNSNDDHIEFNKALLDVLEYGFSPNFNKHYSAEVPNRQRNNISRAQEIIDEEMPELKGRIITEIKKSD